MGATLLAVIAAVGLAWTITRSITGPINDAVTVAQIVASGDLTSTIEVKGRDEVSQLLTALKAMTASLASIVGEVCAGTETNSTASRQIASGNQDLSSRTEEQASSLEETASSMEELTSTVKQSADNARQANVLANSASEVAVRGGAVAAQVVASEVRNLAQRSASAAKEIKALIGNSVEKVGAGAKLVDQAVSQMDLVTQQNAALVEEAAAAAESMQAQAVSLALVVDAFKLAPRQGGGAIAKPHAQLSVVAPRGSVTRLDAPSAAKRAKVPVGDDAEWAQF